MNKKMRRAKKYHSVKYNNFKYDTLDVIFGHKVDEFSLIYCQDWFIDPSPEYYGKGLIFWDKIPLKYLKVPKTQIIPTGWDGSPSKILINGYIEQILCVTVKRSGFGEKVIGLA